jgi:hypothetical protein
MKIRNGFVSNSSSSSFCIVGKQYSEEEYETIFNDLDWESPIYGVRITEYDPYTVGLNITTMKDNETLAEFKKRAYEEIHNIDQNIKLEDITIHVDGGYDG